MDDTTLHFVTYCIGNLAQRLGHTPGEVYRALKDSGMLYDYIVPCSDVLHTFSYPYIMDDLLDGMKLKGVTI